MIESPDKINNRLFNFHTPPGTFSRFCVALACRTLGNRDHIPDSVAPSSRDMKLPENGSLREIARVCAENASQIQRVGWSQNMDFVGRAMSTSDFSAILADVANKQLAVKGQYHVPKFTEYAAPGSLPDFKPTEISMVTGTGLLPEIKESGEFKKLYVTDNKETVNLKTYGGILSITRQVVINDDLNALDDRINMMNQTASLTQSTIVTGVLTGSANLTDGNPLFQASRGNLMTGATTVLSADSLAAAIAKMRKFTDKGGNPLAIEPKFLVVGPGNERLAYQLAYSDTDPGTSNSGTVNFIKKSVGLEIIVDPMVESSSLTAWYLLPDPSIIPVIRYFTLGSDSLAPYVESQQGFSNDALEFKTRIDFSAAAISTYAVKSAGA